MPFAPQTTSPDFLIFASTRSRSLGSVSFAMTSEDMIVAARAPCPTTSSIAASTRVSAMAKITCSTRSGSVASDA